MAHDTTAPFTLNTALTIRGMDLAAGSVIAAAVVVHAALACEDVSGESLGRYWAALASSFVGADLATYAKAPSFLERPQLYGQVGELVADVMHVEYSACLECGTCRPSSHRVCWSGTIRAAGAGSIISRGDDAIPG